MTQEKIIEESQEIRDRVFKQGEQESIILANSIYDLKIAEQQEKFISPGVMQKLK